MDENENIINPFLSLPDSMYVTMKIIKETYGNPNSTFINLYYVIFTHKIMDSSLGKSNNTHGGKTVSKSLSYSD
jgi:hypothetical protein